VNRAERRRVEQQRPGDGLAVDVEALVAPGHWHVDGVAFSHEQDGVFMNAIHLHNLVTNDLVLTETVVLRTVHPLNGPVRDKVRTEAANYCDDPKHLDAAQIALVQPKD
jgi:hypothetical protein